MMRRVMATLYARAGLIAALLLGETVLGCSADDPPESPQAAVDSGSPIVDSRAPTPDASAPDDDGPPPVTCPAEPRIADGGNALVLESECGASASLTPRVTIDGALHEPASCVEADGALVCDVGAAGQLVVTAEGGAVQVRLEATAEGTVEGFELVGTATLPGAVAWLSNGFQSWSSSGIVAIGAAPGSVEQRAAVELEGEAEVLRAGHTHGWWHTWIGGGELSLLWGALTATRFRSWAVVWRDGEDVRLRLVAGLHPADRVAVSAGETLEAETWLLRLTDDLEAAQVAFGEALPSHRSTGALPPAEAGWNSWYELWDQVDEDAVRANAELAKTTLTPLLPTGAPPLRIVVDDGWQVAWGEWTPNDKFPSGLDGLANDLKADGFEVGVWMAPLLVDDDSALVAEHPEWFVQGATYKHFVNGPMKILDPTHPEAAAHLQGFVKTVVGWGYDFLKIDFLFTGTYAGTRHEAVTGMAAYARALELIRAAAGDDIVLLAVGAPGMPSLPWVDAWRLGPDIAFSNTGANYFFLPSQARSISARWPLCLATLCDADPPLLRDLPREEVDLGIAVVGISGGAMFLSDDLRVLPDERRAWLDADDVALAMSGQPAVPTDAFAAPGAAPAKLTNYIEDQFANSSTHVVSVVWRLPGGGHLLLNVSDAPVEALGQTVPPRTAVRAP